MTAALVSLLVLLGAFFMLVAALGLVRMPDLYMRISCNTKAVTLGIGFLLLALAVRFGETDVIGRALAVLAFIGLTVPVSSHLIGRAAYRRGVPLWEKTRGDELKEITPGRQPSASSSPGEPPPGGK